jgi:uncharacterized protein (TIGR03437 family)
VEDYAAAGARGLPGGFTTSQTSANDVYKWLHFLHPVTATQSWLAFADKPDGVKRLIFTIWIAGAPALAAPIMKATPASLAFSYLVGQTGLPAAQTINVAPSSGATALTITGAVTGGPWLVISPSSGRTPLVVRVVVNPTGLPVGTYTGSVTFTAGGSGDPASIPVSLAIKAPPPTLTAAPAVLNFTWVRGDAPPVAQALNFATSGALVSFTASGAGASWLTLAPASGIAFPAFVTTVKVAVNPDGLEPGTYKATISVAAPEALNKTQTIAVNLTVQPGKPTINTLWPERVPAVSDDSTVTLTGTLFYPGSTVRVNGIIVLRPVVIGSTAMTVVMPAALLGAAQTFSVTVVNPSPGGGTSLPKLFQVMAATPRIAAIVDAASYLLRPLAPGQLVTLFGSTLGPDTLITFATPLVGIIFHRLAGVEVFFDGIPAPILYASATQVGTVVPYALAGRSECKVRVNYDGMISDEFKLELAPSAPGIFTASGTGSGQAAVFNADDKTGELSLNSDSNAAAKGSIIVLYATGEGQTNPAGVDGRIASEPSTARNPSLSVEIGGVPAEVLYAGAAPGLVAGVMQINVKIPANLTVSRTSPVVLKIGSAASQPGVTVAVK